MEELGPSGAEFGKWSRLLTRPFSKISGRCYTSKFQQHRFVVAVMLVEREDVLHMKKERMRAPRNVTLEELSQRT